MNQDQWAENTLQEAEENILSTSTLQTSISQENQQKRPREERSSSANIAKEFIIQQKKKKTDFNISTEKIQK